MIRASFTKFADERGAFSRENRRYTQGTVVDVDTVNATCTVNVGDALPDGTVQHLFYVPYIPHARPNVKDPVSLGYSTSSPMSVYIVGVRLGGDNSTGSVPIVTSLAASGHPGITGDVVLVAGAGVTLSESGQDITIASSAAVPHALLDGSVDNDTVAGAPATGDLIYANATPLWTKRAIGSTGQVLTVVGGLPTWAAASGGSHALLDGSVDSDTVAHAPVVGDLITGVAGPLWGRLPIGSSGTFLKVVSGVPTWSIGTPIASHALLDNNWDADTAAHAPVKGDLIYANGTPQWNGLPIGSAGQVLGISGGVPAWQVPSSWNVAITSTAGGTFTVGATDTFVLVFSETNAWTVALPNPTTCRGRMIVVLDAYQGASAGLTLSTATGNILGPGGASGTTFAMGNSGTSRKCAMLVSDGTNWQVFNWTTGN